MTKNETTSSTTEPDASVDAVKDVGGDQVQEAFDKAEEKGFFGQVVDDTPRDNYTLSGAGSGAKTPETDMERRMSTDPKRTLAE